MINQKIEIINTDFVLKRNIEQGIPGIMKIYRDPMGGSDSEIRQVDDNGNQRPVRLMIDTTESKTVKWVGTAKYNELWDRARVMSNKIREHFKSVDNWKRNIEHMPPGTTELFDIMRIDITRRMMEIADLVGFFATEEVNADFDNPITAQWLYEYVAPFLPFNGTGEKVNMVYTRLGDKTPIYFELAGVGFHQDLYNMLFNKIFSMQKVNAAVAKHYVLRRNENVINPIISFSYPTNKLVTPVTGTNFSIDQQYYDTLVKAIKTLGMLKDFQTGEEIDILSGLTLLTHSTRVFPWLRAISGQLLNGDQVKNLTALTPIVNRIIPYNEKTYKYFEKIITYRGCDTDYSYLFVPPPNQNWYLTKKPLTHQTGPGDTFSLSSEKDAWYTVDGTFSDHFFGGDTSDDESSNDPEVMTQEYGYVIKIGNPEDVGNESET